MRERIRVFLFSVISAFFIFGGLYLVLIDHVRDQAADIVLYVNDSLDHVPTDMTDEMRLALYQKLTPYISDALHKSPYSAQAWALQSRVYHEFSPHLDKSADLQVLSQILAGSSMPYATKKK